jgi:hypothetical protein
MELLIFLYKGTPESFDRMMDAIIYGSLIFIVFIIILIIALWNKDVDDSIF